MRVLLAASECAPLVKVGGIADVVGSLPIALQKLGIDIRVVLPYYEPLLKKLPVDSPQVKEIQKIQIAYGDQNKNVTIYQTVIPNTQVKVYLIHEADMLSNGGVYYSPDAMPSTQAELDRFAFFSRVVCDAFTYPDSIFHPDVIHCNDWHTGLVPQIIQSTHRFAAEGLPKTIFTIHNLGYQGFSKLDVADKLGLDIRSDQTLSWDAQDDNLDFVLQGIVGADFVTTVSEKYSKEIQTPEHGEGLQDILLARAGRLVGILNGISYQVFDPLKDTMIYHNFSISNWKTEKVKNKVQLLKDMGMEVDQNRPLLAVVSRLAHQKGLDLVADSLDQIMKIGFHFVLLGTGDPQLEAKFKEFGDKNDNGSYKANITFSEDIARKIYAGSDMFLIPSRYEPSGLTQMIAMKYGSVPVVRETGGLDDTVTDGITGFTYTSFDQNEMLDALKRAAVLYSSRKDEWEKLVETCMQQDFSWEVSAQKYVMLYRKAINV